MTVIAFLYDDYYCWSPLKNFRGQWEQWEEIEDALTHIHGGRDSKQNLELMDIDTFEWRSYRWQPLFKVKELDKVKWKGPDGPDDFANDGYNIVMWPYYQDFDDPKTVKHRFEWDWPTRRWGFEGNAMYDAGMWEEE